MAEHRAVESLKWTFEFCWTIYYSTLPIICTQTRIHCTQSLHYDKSLKQGSPRYIITTNFAATIYHGDISFRFARYRCSKFSLDRYLGEISRDCTDISLIYRFSIRQPVRFIADTSARNRENKARYSSIIICITFAQYCRIETKINFIIIY